MVIGFWPVRIQPIRLLFILSHCFEVSKLALTINSYKPCNVRKGHQESFLVGHSFVFLNVSINKKPVFFSEVVTFKKIAQSSSAPAFWNMSIESY
jgi:hypothetical protein